jgi:TfoX/Sxy family transcriptional regulator of competence genes
MTAASDALADRLRPLLPELAEKSMFGGKGFMRNGNMAIGTTAKGALLIRIDPARQADALARSGAYEMHMGPRPMAGFIAVDPETLTDEAALRGWIAYALTYAETLPPK